MSDKLEKAIEKLTASNKAQAMENAQIQAEIANKKFDADKAKSNEMIDAIKNASSEDKSLRIKEFKAFKNQQKQDQKRDNAIDSSRSQDRIKLDEQKAELSAMKENLESQGKNASDNKEFNKAELAVTNKEFDLRQAEATSPSAKKEIKKEQRKANEGQLTILGKIGDGIGGLLQSGKDGAKNAGKTGLALLKGTVLAGLMFAIAAFLKSKYFKDTIDFLTNEVMPALKDFYENILKPIGEVIFDVFVKQFETIGELFDNIGESIQMFKDGDILGGINGIINSLATFITDSIDNVITGIYNLFAKTFGLEETDSVNGSISKFFSDLVTKISDYFVGIYDSISTFITTKIDAISKSVSDTITSVKKFFTDGFANAKEVMEKDFNEVITFVTDLKIFKYIKDIFGDLWEGITGIFSGDFSTENFGKIFGSLFDIITNPLNLAINAIMDIFGFGEDESDFGQKTPFRLSEFISKKIRDIIAIFTDWFSTIKIPSIGEIVSMAKDGFSKIGSFLFGDGDSDEEKIDKLYTKQEKILKEAQGLPATQRQEKMKEFKSVQTEIDAVQKKNSISNVATISDAQLQNTQPSKLEKMRMTGGTDGAAAVASSGNTINATPTKNSAPIIINAPTNTSQSSINNKTTQVAASVMVEPDPFFRRNTQYDY